MGDNSSKLAMDRPRTVRFLLATSALAALMLIGPRWPNESGYLICSPSRHVEAVFRDMATCEEELRPDCGCMTRNWPSEVFYATVVPLVFVFALWTVSPSLAKAATAALLVILCVSELMPLLLLIPVFVPGLGLIQNQLVAWPQYVFFGPTMMLPGQTRTPLLPVQQAYLLTLAFWALASVAFGLVMRRVGSFSALLACAAVFVAIAVEAVRLVAWAFGWRLVITSI